MRIRVDGLEFGYGKNSLFRDLFLEVSLNESLGRGRAYAILGSSGSGKTTLLRLLAGLQAPRKGIVELTGVSSLDVGVLAQKPVLLPNLSVLENARLFAKIASTRKQFDERLFLSSAARLAVGHLLSHERSVSTLSGGEAQRIALLRALSVKPKVLFLDEPCNGLDASLRFDFVADLRRLMVSSGMLVFYVTHHLDEAGFLADDFLYVDRREGRAATVDCGNRETLLQAPRSVQAVSVLLGEPVNEVPASGEGEVVRVLAAGWPSVLRCSSTLFGPIVLAIPARHVRFGDIKESGSHRFTVAASATEADRPVVGVGGSINQRSLPVVEGDAYSFAADESAGRLIRISSRGMH